MAAARSFASYRSWRLRVNLHARFYPLRLARSGPNRILREFTGALSRPS